MSQNSSPLVGRGAWWGDRTVKTKILATVAVSAVATGVVGFMGLQALSNAAASADSMYTSHTKGVDTAADISSAVGEHRPQRPRHDPGARAPRTQPPTWPHSTVSARRSTQAIQAYSATGLDAASRPVVNELVSTMTKYRAYLKDTLAPIAVSGNLQQWVVENDAHGPAMTDVLDKDAQTLRDIELTAAAQQDAQVRADYQSQKTTSILVMLVGILGAVGLGLVVAVGIARAARKVQAVAEALAAGDLTTRQRPDHPRRARPDGFVAGRGRGGHPRAHVDRRRVGGRGGGVVGGAVAPPRRRSRRRRRRPRRSRAWCRRPRRRSPAACRRWPPVPSRWARASGRSRRTRPRPARWRRGR